MPTSDGNLVEITCAHCSKALRVDRKLVGRHGRCPHCNTKFLISEPKPKPKQEKKPRPAPAGTETTTPAGEEEYEELPPLALLLPWWEDWATRARLAVPCWGISIAIHLALLVMLALITVSLPAREEDRIQVNVQLKAQEDKKDVYLKKEDLQRNLYDTLPQRSSPFTADVAAPTVGITAGSDRSGVVPVIGISGSVRPGGGSPFAVASGPVSFFGSGGGKDVASVVFVIDRSASMEGPKLATAKEELCRSVERLTVGNMFNVIFFSDAGTHKSCWPKAVLATMEHKKEAYDFIKAIESHGGTNPISALEVAIRSRPDLIYLLTDGEFDQGRAAIKEIHELLVQYAGGRKIRINTIAFKSHAGEGTLRQIAVQTNGQYRYVD